MVIAAFARRDHARPALAGDVERVASTTRTMAAGFRLGGKPIVFGDTDGAPTGDLPAGRGADR
ncbi:hypothetical protein [Streptosporangium sp. NPDC002721]|uniref:hypothetical protein n=1 Tax=Streptosporangium sp. NPDC002721 TaxID=3366188 RepID=UPI0036BAADB9